MKNYKKLDHLTGQEIKEMITNKEIKLEDLSVSALNRLFEYESDATCRGESDGTLLCRCADVLAQKEGFAEEHDKAFSAELDRVMQSVSTELPPVRKPLRLKKALLVAAAAAVLLCCASVVVAALGFDVCGYFKGLVFSPAGSKIEENGITLVHYGQTAQYASMEELLAAEKLNIMYPAKLPEGVRITEVNVIEGEDAKETIEIITTDEKISICIELSAKSTGSSFADCARIKVGNITYYVHKEYLYAVTGYNGNYYYIQASNYENILLIINHMKEYKS